jgi:hypothetical protein
MTALIMESVMMEFASVMIIGIVQIAQRRSALMTATNMVCVIIKQCSVFVRKALRGNFVRKKTANNLVRMGVNALMVFAFAKSNGPGNIAKLVCL